MGLDTVELVIDVEKRFDISIPNHEAENIYTVQDFADCVFNKVLIRPTLTCKSRILFYRFRAFLVDKLSVSRNEVLLKTKISDLIPVDRLKWTWKTLETDLEVELPALSELDYSPTTEADVKFFGFKVWTRKAAVTTGTMEDLVNWTLALNHKKFVDPKNLCSRRDIELVIIGIISEDLGVPVDEIKLTHSITGDLGAD
jgi:acyl carrier protein